MRFRDFRIRRFVAQLRLLSDYVDVYELETQNCARDSTIYINGIINDMPYVLELKRLKFAPTELVLRDVSNHGGKILELWQDCINVE